MKLFILISSLLLTNAFASESLHSQLEKKKKSSKAPVAIKKVMKKGVDDLRSSGIEKRTLTKGRKLPAFSLVDKRGIITPIKNIYSKNPLVITFYRGAWCPYCKLELKAYELLKEEFDKAGATIVALSPDKWNEIRKTKDKLGLTFDLYRDENNNIAKRMGLAFKVDGETLKLYSKFGINLEKSQGNDLNELPMPGTYVIDTKGVIRFAFTDPDYKKRAEPSEVLRVVRSLK
ncbi:MAG: AhpC/TSA family protein [Bacteriovoracaceae bacterium]|nr:AhpC/TSA family protein [Bacteriovoracaceae bacterium]